MPGVEGILAPILWRVGGPGTSFLSDTSGEGDRCGDPAWGTDDTASRVGAGGDAGDDDGLLTDAEVGADTGDFGDEDGDMF
jgi:hypothetical protein